MAKKDRTTINIEKETRKMLKEAQKYPRETYDYTIKELIKKIKKKKGLE